VALAACLGLGVLLLGGALSLPLKAKLRSVGSQVQTRAAPLPAYLPSTPREQTHSVVFPDPKSELPAQASTTAVAAREHGVVRSALPSLAAGGPAPSPFRRQALSEEQLGAQLVATPTLALDRTAARAESIEAYLASRAAALWKQAPADPTVTHIDRRPDLIGLPLRRGSACVLTAEQADHFDEHAKALRRAPPTPQATRELGAGDSKTNVWLRAESVPVLMQMLMAEEADVRVELAGLLSLSDTPQATEALARLALFDLSSRARRRAIEALAVRPGRDYRGVLLKGFAHPWWVVADHAAEALVALKVTDAVPELTELVNKTDPAEPFQTRYSPQTFVREMVRVNHLQNCLLCHPASVDPNDKLRGPIPETDQPVPSDRSVYYAPAPQRVFVQAGVTYLKQDFSVMMKVASPGKWPEMQRFDFFVRERVAHAGDFQRGTWERAAGRWHRAVRYALRGLTAQNAKPELSDAPGR
jgi:hypothetical protein